METIREVKYAELIKNQIAWNSEYFRLNFLKSNWKNKEWKSKGKRKFRGNETLFA